MGAMLATGAEGAEAAGARAWATGVAGRWQVASVRPAATATGSRTMMMHAS